MKNLIITLVVLFTSINIYSQTINIQTTKKTDSYNLLNKIDSSVIYNRQVFTSPDSIGVTAIFPAGAIPMKHMLSVYKTKDSATQLLFEEIAAIYQVIQKTDYEYRIDLVNGLPKCDSFEIKIEFPKELIAKKNPNYEYVLFAQRYDSTSMEYSDNFYFLESKRKNGFISAKFDLSYFSNHRLNNKTNLTFVICLIPVSILDSLPMQIHKLKKNFSDELLENMDGKILCPIKGNKGFDWKIGGFSFNTISHPGVDIIIKKGTKIYAVKSGKILKIGKQTVEPPTYDCFCKSTCYSEKSGKGYGNRITIDHLDGSISVYAHLSNFLNNKNNLQRKVGDYVEEGELIALSGGVSSEEGSGCSSGEHLHFEYKEKDNPINPELIFRVNPLSESKYMISDKSGNSYTTYLMPDGREWMTQNLRSGSFLQSNIETTNDQKVEMFGYGDNPANCLKYGGLYSWDEAMNYPYTTLNTSNGKFPSTVVTDIKSTSKFATTENGFSKNNCKTGSQDLVGQCTWYVEARIRELAEAGYLDKSSTSRVTNALCKANMSRDAKNWDNIIGGIWFETSIKPLPVEMRKPGLIVVYDFDPNGHVAFVEEVSTDKKKYKVSEFNIKKLQYDLSNWLPFVGDDKRGMAYPKFYDVSLVSQQINSSKKDICPDGWYIPSKTEWEKLTNSISNNFNIVFSPQYGGNMQRNQNTQFGYIDLSANYWTSTTDGNGNAFQVRFNNINNPINPNQIIGPFPKSKSDAICIRCIKELTKNIKSIITNSLVGIGGGGQEMTIEGDNFGTESENPPVISFNNNNEPVKLISFTNQNIVFAIPEKSNYGNLISVKPQTGGESNTVYLRVDEKATKPYPFLHFTSPTSTYEGEEITIYGNNFGKYDSVTSSLKLNDLTIKPVDWTNDTIIFKLPPGSSSGNLLLQVEDRKSKPYYFQVMEKPAPTPYIYYTEPQMARVDDTVEIHGLNFGLTQNSSTVTFNNSVIDKTIFWSDKIIKLTVPTGVDTGGASVMVKVNQDTSNQLYFVVLPPPQQPQIDTITPNHFQIGERITIHGNYFGYNASGTDFVKFGDSIVATKDISDWYNTQITLKVPSCDTLDSIRVTIGKLKSEGYAYKIDAPKNDSTDTITDVRDNGVYKTIKIGDQWWMAENLRIGKRIDTFPTQSNNDTTEKYNYDNNSSNDSLYGGLYLWDEAMKYDTISGAQGICPIGWHIPSDSDWKALEINLRMTQADADSETKLTFRGSDQGKKLKVGGSSGFNAKMSGSYFGAFNGLGDSTYFWTSSKTGSENAFSRHFDKISDGIGREDDLKTNGYCIRCMKDK